jgi:hypothetical protein
MLSLTALITIGCGARTTLDVRDLAADAADASIETALVECTRSEECEGFGDRCAPVACVDGRCIDSPPVFCDDLDPCTDDACDPATGACVHTPKTLDSDGDGFRAPLPGKRPGEPGACGDDCDDTSARAFPGAEEVCDGVDNDCNGVVDDDARYVPATGADAILISDEGTSPATPGGIAWSGERYFAAWNATTRGGTRVQSAFIDRDGKKGPTTPITNVIADAFDGRAVWTGAYYGTSWGDRRTGAWETWFSRLNAKGEKLAPDLLVSDDDGAWSINSTLVWTAKEFVIAWQDQRDLAPDFGIWGQRLDQNGRKIGGNVKLVDGQGGGPELAVGLGTLGLTWTVTSGRRRDVWAAIFDRELRPKVRPFRLTSDAISGVFPQIAWNRDRYVVAWYDPDQAKKAVYGATFDEAGAIKQATRALTESPRASRYPALLPLGDRVLLVFSDTKDGGAYELYTKMLDTNLAAIGGEQRITRAAGDSIFPVATFGPSGDVGVLFRDDRAGGPNTYFTRLVCRGGR